MKKKELKYMVIEIIEKLNSIDKRLKELEQRETPEELNLLEHKPKELVVGKWYKYQYLCDGKYDGYLLFNFNGKFSEDSQYGFTHTSIGHKFVDDISIYREKINKYTEATPQEIESTLIDEAKMRGHKYDSYSWNHEQNTLYANRGNDVGHDILFENGVWAEVIKPEEKLKIGDVCKFWDDDEDVYLIGCITDIDISSSFPFLLYDYDWFRYAKTLTQQEAIDLLFNK